MNATGFAFTPNTSESGIFVQFVGANPSVPANKIEATADAVGFFEATGAASAGTSNARFTRLEYLDIYPGIDARYDPTPSQNLEYTFVVHPGADPDTIRLNFDGASNLTLNADGDLLMTTPAGALASTAPILFQDISGTRVDVAGSYELLPNGDVGFAVGAYDPSRTLLIDPEMEGVVTITAAGSQVLENHETGYFAVTRTGDVSEALTVNYAVSGTADWADIYLSDAHFFPGEASTTVALSPTVDGWVEWPETVVVTLTSGEGYTVGTPSSATLTIIDEDPAAFVWSNSTTQPPILSSPGHQFVAEGDAVSVFVEGWDPEDEELTFAATGLPEGLSIAPATGEISGTVSYRAAQLYGGLYVGHIFAVDGQGGSTTITMNWQVANTNRLPSIDEIANQTGALGDSVSLAVTADDPDLEQNIYFEATGLPDGLYIDLSTGVIEGTIFPSNPPGSYTVTVEASDLEDTVTRSFSWTVTAPNAPAVTNPGDQSNTEGATVSLQITATVPGGGTITYGAVGLPDGLTIDTNTGLISGTIANTEVGLGVLPTRVIAYHGLVWTEVSFDWTVSPYVTIEEITDQSSAEGQTVSLQVEAEAVAGTLSYSAEGLPGGLTINETTGLISGTVDTNISKDGPLPVTVKVTANNYSAWRHWIWAVTRPTNDDPTLSSVANQTNMTGDIVSLPLTAADDDDDHLTFSAEGLPPGLSIVGSTGEIVGEVLDDAVSEYPYSVTITVDDNHGGTASTTFTWTISDSTLAIDPIPISGYEGQLLDQVLIGAFTDTREGRNAGEYGVTVDWGDYETSTGFVVESESVPGLFEIYASHTYVRPDTYTFTLEVTTPAGTTFSAYGEATIDTVPLAVTGGGTHRTANYGSSSSQNVAYITDTNRLRFADEYTATVTWSNGNTDQGIVTGQDGTFAISVSSAFMETGFFTGTLEVTDGDGQTVSTQIYADVGDFFTGSKVGVTTSTYQTKLGLGGITATVYWGDGTSESATIVPVTAETFTVETPDHVYGEKGNYTVTVTVISSAGNRSESQSIRVVDAPLRAVGNLAIRDEEVLEEQLIGVFADANPLNTASDFAASFDWGNGEAGVATQIVQLAPGLYKVIAGHVYATTEGIRPYVMQLILAGNILQIAPRQMPMAQQKAQQKVTFFDALEKAFSDWNWADNQGWIKLSKVNQLVDSHSVKDSQAAAAAVLKAYVLHNPSKEFAPGKYLQLFGLDPTKWDINSNGLAFAHIKIFEGKLKMGNQDAVELQHLYEYFLAKIRATKQQLFDPNTFRNRPNLWEQVVQGEIGDCGMLAGTIGLIHSHGLDEFVRERILEIEPQNGIRRFRVAFGDVTRDPLAGDQHHRPTYVTIEEPTHGQLALYARTTDHYLWLPVFEKAYVTEWNRLKPTREIETLYDVAIHGEKGPNSIQNITFHESQWNVMLPEFRFPPNFTLKGLIQQALEKKKVILVGSRKLERNATNWNAVPPNPHAFAVVGFNDTTNSVILQNPHNNPNDPWGVQKEITLDTLRTYFQNISIEGHKDLY